MPEQAGAWPVTANTGLDLGQFAELPPTGLVSQLHNLQIFLAVAQAGSMARAAEGLYKAPSAITRSITELERVIGTPLLLRSSRGASLTRTGQAVQLRSERIAQEIALAAALFIADGSSHGASLHAVTTFLANGRKLMLISCLAALRNISLAASRIGVTQAGASMALARIEEVLGQPLFQRRSDGMFPTTIAEKLVNHIRRIFAELRHIASDVSTQPGVLRGTVVIGTTPLGRTERVLGALADVVGRHPGVRVTTAEGSYEHLSDLVLSGEVDIAIGAMRPSHQCSSFVTEPLFADRLAVLAGANHPFVKRNNLTLADLAGERWILPRANALGGAAIEAAFRAIGLPPPQPAIETGDLAIVRHLLRTTDLLAITTPHQLAEDIRVGELHEVAVKQFDVARTVGLIRRRDAVLSPAGQLVIDSLRHLGDRKLEAA